MCAGCSRGRGPETPHRGPPADGRANAEVVRFLARTIGVSGSEVDVIQGASGRDKVVRVKATDAETVARSLSGSL